MAIPLSHVLGKDVNFQDFDASGTWVHPEPGVAYHVHVELYGGGGGGGGGAARIETVRSSNSCEGGDGGGAGALHILDLILTEDQSVTVGTGGAGGAGGAVTGAASANADGADGVDGAESRFGPYKAAGGNNGVKGIFTTSVSGLPGPPPNLYINCTSANSNAYSQGDLGSEGTTVIEVGAQARGGRGASSWRAPAPSGGDGALSGVGANVTAENGETADPSNYGAGGAGGGGARTHPIAASRTATAGNGGNGVDGRVRVWAWRVG